MSGDELQVVTDYVPHTSKELRLSDKALLRRSRPAHCDHLVCTRVIEGEGVDAPVTDYVRSWRG